MDVFKNKKGTWLTTALLMVSFLTQCQIEGSIDFTLGITIIFDSDPES
jgi:hypothetical protein